MHLDTCSRAFTMHVADWYQPSMITVMYIMAPSRGSCIKLPMLQLHPIPSGSALVAITPQQTTLWLLPSFVIAKLWWKTIRTHGSVEDWPLIFPAHGQYSVKRPCISSMEIQAPNLNQGFFSGVHVRSETTTECWNREA